MSLEDEPASPTARVMQSPGFNLCILTLMGFTTTIDVDVFKRDVEQTLVKHPRFCSLLVVNKKSCNQMSWKRTNVNMENHVFAPNLDPNMENPDKFVEDFTSDLSTHPMDMTKPLWEVHILNVKTTYANSTAVFRFHHSMGDGLSLVSLFTACASNTVNPEYSLPVKKRERISKHGFITRLILFVWTMMLVGLNTLCGSALLVATLFFLKDSKTPIKRGRGVEGSRKRFVHRIIDLDDVKLVKNAMNVSINDVVLGVTEAGLSCYLNTRYKKLRQNGSEIMTKTTFLPKNIRLRSAVVFNLRPPMSVEQLAEMLKKGKDLNGMWGNLLGIVILPFTIALQDDPLTYIHRAKATMDRKKLSFESKLSFIFMKLFIKLFGIKITGDILKNFFSNTTLTFSNVVGPKEEVFLFGHSMCYFAPSVYGFDQALIIHYQSYANRIIIMVGADEKKIPNPHELCDDLVKSFENIKDAVIKRGLVKDFQV